MKSDRAYGGTRKHVTFSEIIAKNKFKNPFCAEQTNLHRFYVM